MSPALGAPTIGGTAGVPSPQYLQIRTSDGRYVLTALAGPEPPEVTDGRGGHEEVARNRKPAVTQWVGSSARKTTVTVMLDAWGSQGSVEQELTVVDGLAPVVPTTDPPQIFVVGARGIASTIPWVVTGVTFSERLRRDSDGATSRVQVAFDLLEYRPGDVVVVRADPAKRSVVRNGTPPRTKAKTYTVKRGDTLAAIAARLLGSASKWQSIATLNKIRNPNALKVGQVLKLP